MRYAYNTLVYGDEPIAKGIERVARYGYDGVEIVGEPEKLNTDEVKRALEHNSIPASSVLGIYTTERDLTSANRDIRREAVAYIKSCIRFAQELEAGVVSITPTAVMKIYPEAPREQALEWAAQGIREAGEYAGDREIRLAVEPWNRYETHLINRVAQSVELVERIGLANVGCMGDTFHMNIEERSIPDSVRQVGQHLYHFHAADSNRAAPGEGHIDFRPILQALRDIDYQGYISFELLPAAGDPFLVLQGGEAEEFFDQYTRDAIAHMKQLEGELIPA